MNILIAPDSFKGCMTSVEAAEILGAAAAQCAAAHCTYMPVADGGEGSLDCLLTALGGETRYAAVHSPEGLALKAAFGVTPKGVGILEFAQSSGLTRQTSFRACEASGYGFGELILAALEGGCREFLVCLGGSATTDGGCGFAAALGARFYDAAGEPFVPVGGTLARIVSADLSRLDPRLRECRFTVLSDVTAPLSGPEGAAAVFAPQKGASPAEVALLDRGLAHLGSVLTAATGVDMRNAPGAGAAGGAGYGCMMFLGATVASGIHRLLDLTGFDALAAESDLIVTGEGRLDDQSLMGKVLSGILQRARGKPVVSFCGSCGLTPGKLRGKNPEIVEIGAGLPTAEAIRRGKVLLRAAAEGYFTDRWRNRSR